MLEIEKMMLNYVFPGGKKKVLTFSYDDGNDSDRRLAQIFTDHHMKGTFNLNSGFQAGNGKIHLDELKSVFIEHGHEVACHGKLHPFEDQIPAPCVVEDIREDRIALENAIGEPVRGMAYPFGTTSDEVKHILRSLGIVYSRNVTSTHSIRYFPTDWLDWCPTAHHNQNIAALGDNLLNDPWGLQMLYIWGHADEFEYGKNWNIIEEFCDKMADKDSIWYATNIEIYDYMKACKDLIISMDCHLIKNPSAMPVWIMVDKEIYKIEGGQMLVL